MTLQDDLRAIGLTKTEAAVYLYLLENGVSTPPQIAKGTGILRTNGYHILQTLEHKGLIRPEAGRGKRIAYFASDPEALFRSIEVQREAVSRMLPDLRALYTTQEHKPKIRFYDGLEQVKEVYWLSLEAREIFGIGSTKTLNEVMSDYFKKYVAEAKKRNIIFHDILTSDSKEKSGPFMRETLKGLYDEKYLPEKFDDISTDMLIWNDHTALITLQEPYFATVITSPLIAKTMKTLFYVMQERL
ncbi:hypothetical protein FJZ48_00035 [Candidatus Uhrbacteria bacterium]|nr:hypothetical protein [Candidatus Uhrbacteria bacterium]